MGSAENTNNFVGRLKELFSTNKSTDLTLSPSPIINSENRGQGETYEHWGTRICGIVSGSNTALSPYLQKVFNNIYSEQASNVELQEQARINIQADIDRKNNDIANLGREITDLENGITEKIKRIDELKEEQKEIRCGKEEINKEQKLKLIIGVIILIPLTLYLFLFYSSTFYSAFFRDPQNMTTIMNSMFDSKALAHAYSDGWTELGFVLCAPIIFLGLGFSLHFFSKQCGWEKYLKMSAVLLVTLMFDCILAYKIGEQLHTFGIIIGQYPIGEQYTIGMAFHDINSWAVIFCGFIVYIIWGIVFDMSMTAYTNLDLSKTKLDNIKDNIKELEEKIKTERMNVKVLRQEETDTRSAVAGLMLRLGHETFIDYSSIREEMNNFFAGWIKMMEVLSINKIDQELAANTYNQIISQLIKK